MNSVKKAINDSAVMRWTVLVMVSVLMFATYWYQDFVGPLQGLMREAWGFSNSDFGLIISCTTWLNIVGAIIVGGVILDKFGPKVCIFIFGGLAALGATVSAMGAAGFFGEDPMMRRNMMIVGRIMFGIGLEVTCVLVSKTVVKWFKGYELALAMSINVGFGRLGSMIAIMISADIAGDDPSPAVSFAAVLIGIGVIAYIAHLIFDVKLDNDRKRLAEASADESGGDDEAFKISDLFKLLVNPSFIFVTLLCVTFYSAVFPFIQYAPDLLVNKFGFTRMMPDGLSWGSGAYWDALFHCGPKVAGLIPFGTLFFTPLFGYIVDKKGKAASLMMLGSALLIFAHLSLSVFDSVALGYAGLLALGMAFSLVPAAMWPSVAKIVPESRLGTAYASMFTFQNWGLGLFFWGIGKVLDMVNPGVGDAQTVANAALKAAKAAGDQAAIDAAQKVVDSTVYNYTTPILMLVVLGVVSIFLAFMLKRADMKQGYGLELPSGS
ncbi:MAG: major facilitator superfamily domain-containing protein 1 [Deltaproteobacteria bacterium]|nr:major facilitator superfamily domain-containing protein 1 [Deltaproteobacteria bacterium]